MFLWLEYRETEFMDLFRLRFTFLSDSCSISFSIDFILSIDFSTFSTELRMASETLSSSLWRDGVRCLVPSCYTVGRISVKS